MKPISVAQLSKKYESMLKIEEEKHNKQQAFSIVNNGMIFAFFKINEPNLNDINDIPAAFMEIEKKHGNIFLDKHTVLMFSKDIEYVVNEFLPIFRNVGVASALSDLLGNVLEKHINQKETGSYYTPKDTTKYIAWNSIVMSLINRIPDYLKQTVYKTLNIHKTGEILNLDKDIDTIISIIISSVKPKDKDTFINICKSLKIIDPTCGSGAFIIAAYECLEFIYKTLGVDINSLSIMDSIYGLDIESDAVQLAKMRLLMKANNETDRATEILSSHFIVADAFRGSDFKIEEHGFDWKTFGRKFDCVIGNPPYVEAKSYTSSNFNTNKCGNMYAYAIERACNIAENGGIVSFVVPLSLVSTPRMQNAKSYLEENSNAVYYATFADRPGCIFSGVHQRLTIFFSEIGQSKQCERYSSSYAFWYNEERESLFKSIKFYRNRKDGILAKIGPQIEWDIYKKLTKGDKTFDSLFTNEGNYSVFVSTRIGFWSKAFMTNVFKSKEFKEYKCRDRLDQLLAISIFNSSIFYYLWVVLSDCWHVTNQNIVDLKFFSESVKKIDYNKLESLVTKLMYELEINKKYIGTKQAEYEYKHKYSKETLDEIDKCISVAFNLNKTEIDYILGYTERYRVNNLEEKKPMQVIDLFSGVGGLSCGFRKAGYDIVLANEIDESIAKSYSQNHPETTMINDDIKNILPYIVENKIKADVIIGGPPCQGFSMAGARIRTNKKDAFLNDPRNYLFRHYFAVVQQVEPEFFVMENVPGMLSMSNGEIIREIETLFSDSNNFKNGPYHVYKQILNASEYGVPQDRHRLIIFGTKKDIDIPKLFKDVRNEMVENGEIKKCTIEDAISDLNWLESGEGKFDQAYINEPLTEYQKARRAKSDSVKNHIASNHNEVAIRRMKELKPGGRRLDLAEGASIKSVHSGAYGRMRWDELSKTIITRFDTPSSGVYVHPERNRTLTPREAARIQSFDDDFVFYGNKSSIIKQIGNAVPPLLAYYLARVIKKASEM